MEESTGVTTSATLGFSAGALIRRQCVFEVKAAAQRLGLTVSLLENKGWLESEYQITVTGDQDSVTRFLAAFQQWSRAMGQS